VRGDSEAASRQSRFWALFPKSAGPKFETPPPRILMRASMTIYYESGIQSPLPHFPVYIWDNASTQLETILDSHGETSQHGDRFLVGRLKRQVQMRMITFDYILTRSGEEWEQNIAVYYENTPYEYDFDVFEMRPIETILSH
jgi:hypothetical protein